MMLSMDINCKPCVGVIKCAHASLGKRSSNPLNILILNLLIDCKRLEIMPRKLVLSDIHST